MISGLPQVDDQRRNNRFDSQTNKATVPFHRLYQYSIQRNNNLLFILYLDTVHHFCVHPFFKIPSFLSHYCTVKMTSQIAGEHSHQSIECKGNYNNDSQDILIADQSCMIQEIKPQDEVREAAPE